MTRGNDNLLERFPPGFAAKRYRATPEEIERAIRDSEIQLERDERNRRKLIEQGKIHSDTEPDENRS
jgi:hypothetical protein